MQPNDGVGTKPHCDVSRLKGTPTVHASRRPKQKQTRRDPSERVRIAQRIRTPDSNVCRFVSVSFYAPYSLFGSSL